MSEKLRSFSMQDLTLIRDEDTVHMQSHDPQLRPSGVSLLETIEDSGTEHLLGPLYDTLDGEPGGLP